MATIRKYTVSENVTFEYEGSKELQLRKSSGFTGEYTINVQFNGNEMALIQSKEALKSELSIKNRLFKALELPEIVPETKPTKAKTDSTPLSSDDLKSLAFVKDLKSGMAIEQLKAKYPEFYKATE